MDSFRRTLRSVLLLAGFIMGLATAVALFFTRYLVRPPRQRLWSVPTDLGMEYEEVQFPAQDGVRLSGWFLPALATSRRKGATLVLVHGWPWNRLGNTADDLLSNFSGSTPVDLLRLAYALHHAGFHVLMMDLRNHGLSAEKPPVMFGREEAKDLLGALAYLNGRSDVAANRLGVIGFSMGANTVLYSLPHTKQIQAAVLVQPTSAGVFAPRFAAHLLGVFSRLVFPLTELFYRLAGGVAFTELQPAQVARQAGQTPLLFIQGSGDPWGSVADVMEMTAVTPNVSGPLIVETTERYGGYQYLVENPQIAVAFFEQHLPE